MRASEHAWFNGRIVPRERADPSVASNTLHLGISVFDGIMAYRNGGAWNLHRGREHVERFHAGAARMGLRPGWTVDQVLDGIGELLGTLPARTHYIRPIAYRTAPEVFFHVDNDSASFAVFAVPVGRDADDPYTCQLSPIRRVSHHAIPASWKVSGAYANSFLAEEAARAAGFDTGLMLDQRGRVAEASSSNVFFVTADGLVTPRLDGDVFPGITRATILEIARRSDLAVIERDVWPAELASVEAALLCGTLSEIRHLGRIGDHRYDSGNHPVVRRLIDQFRSLTHA
ncbi:aminotransferase class IV [Saccharothrix variisporea]|uniref:Branched-chain amino acid aminotransferase n=1 Tax=Saccharothrix variisporea TaxID=543527 RepID=A0A495XL93_9PSEU|nr:aminotransferase class IV [Saccharothrix variisporea]RKT74419.1 branched-chain amino acid aminotransferase [Saccharothrix variisporea]